MSPYRTAPPRPRGPRVFEPWAERLTMLLALLCSTWIVVCLSQFAMGCAASRRDQAITAANVGRELGGDVALVLHSACTVPYQAAETAAETGHADQARAEMARLDTFCPALEKAYTTFAALQAALVAAVQVSAPDADLARLQGQLEAAGMALANALESTSGGAR